MMDYKHVGVASAFSPTFTAVLAEAKCFAIHCGADLEVVHAGASDIEKEKRLVAALGQRAAIRWVAGETAAQAIIAAVKDFAYDLLIAGTPDRETDDKSFAGDVAPELLRNAPCDLLLVPRPLEEPTAPQHIVFVSEPEQEEDFELLRRAVEVLHPQRVTIVVTERPFAPAIAASRGEQPRDVEAWLEELASSFAGHQVCSVVIRPKWNLLKCDSEEAAKQSKRSISIGLEKSILPQIKIHPNDSILGFILFAMVRAKTRVRSLGFIAALGEPIHESRLDCISTWLVVANKKHPQHQILQYVAGCLDRNKPAQMS
jgi:nucleotide-binding universal stress UspA family protein